MFLDWFNAREATRLAAALADQFPLQAAARPGARGKQDTSRTKQNDALANHLRRAAVQLRALRLNFYKRAMFANSFKWRLLERGVDASTAAVAAQTLVLEVALQQPAAGSTPETASTATPVGGRIRSLLTLGDEALARGAYAEAAAQYRQFLTRKPGHVGALNSLGSALYKLGRFKEAEDQFRRAIKREPSNATAHANLGTVHLSRGLFLDAVNSLRRALKLKPGDVDQRSNLGLALAQLGRLEDARAQFEKVLRAAPRHAAAWYGMGVIARTEGNFSDARAAFERALAADPKMAQAWSELAGLRRMSLADADWVRGAEEMASGPCVPREEAQLRFAIGKYYDDVGEYASAFESYKRANELLKTITAPYDREMRTRLVDDLIRVYTPEAIARIGGGASASTKPTLVVGMMRSGTSLAEQIIASHPAAAGAGELEFWNDAMRRHESQARQGLLAESTRRTLAEAYLRALDGRSCEAACVVDKMPLNSDYLGVIHSVFPKARIIYMQREPLDACLSSYFQSFSTALNFTMDLADLAHYYREHERLMAHWRAVLPQGTILEVPYEGLVAEQGLWTRRILEFLGLDWDERCLEFHRTNRPVVTASYWQVRQQIYCGSVQRWRHYRKFIGPLLELRG